MLHSELDLQTDDWPDKHRLTMTLDDLNQRYGRGTAIMASAELDGD